MSTSHRTMQLGIVGQEQAHLEFIRTDRYTLQPFAPGADVVPSASVDAVVLIASDDLVDQLNVARCAFPRTPLVLIAADEFLMRPIGCSPRYPSYEP